jgi:hypothetical protein
MRRPQLLGTPERPVTIAWLGVKFIKEYQAVVDDKKPAVYKARSGAISVQPRVYPGLLFGANSGAGR